MWRFSKSHLHHSGNLASCLLLLVIYSTASFGSAIHTSDGEEAEAAGQFESQRVPRTEQDTGSQHLFPSFASFFSHGLGDSHRGIESHAHHRGGLSESFPVSRLGFGSDDTPSNHRARHIPSYSPQSANSFQPSGSFFSNSFNQGSPNKYSSGFSSSSTSAPQKPASTEQVSVLGSGNFGLIRGGTFYDDDYDSDDFFSSYGSHSRPQQSNHRPTAPDEFFANFRDFADITGAKQAGSFSEFHVVYAANSPPKSERVPNRPRNIFEQLASLDEEEPEVKSGPKKVSKHKEKLAKLKVKQEEKARKRYPPKASKSTDTKESLISGPKDLLAEPLLALS